MGKTRKTYSPSKNIRRINKDMREYGRRTRRHNVRMILRSYDDPDDDLLYEDEILKKNLDPEEKSD